jgi:hypothetical protein
MRPTMLGVAALALAITGCVTVAPPQQPTIAPTSASMPASPPGTAFPPLSGTPLPPSLPVLPSAPSRPPALSLLPATPAAPTVTVVVGDGADAQTYVAAGDPNCSYGVVDDGVWGAAWGDLSAADGHLSDLQLTDEPDTSGGKDARIVSAYIVVGPVFGGTGYTLSFDRFGAKFTREVDDRGSTATIHLAGKTTASMLGPGGVLIDLTVVCPTVNRG